MSHPTPRGGFTNLGSDPSTDELHEILADFEHMWEAMVGFAMTVPGAAATIEPRSKLPPIVSHVFGMAAAFALSETKAIPSARSTCCGEWDTIGTKCADCPWPSSAIEEPEFICKKCGCRHICPTDHERVNW